METIYGAQAGKINLTTGRTKYFNVFENFEEDNGTLVLLQNERGNYTVVAGAGTPTSYECYAGTDIMMNSNGRNRSQNAGISTHACSPEGLAEIKNVVQEKKCKFWVFK